RKYSSFLAVNVFGGVELRFSDFETGAAVLHGAEKAGLVTFVARRADLLDLNQESIAVAVEGNVLDRLSVAAGFAFHPELLAGAAPEMGFARLDSFFQRSAIHPGHHQHAPGGLFLDNGGNQAAGGVEFQLIVKAHVVSEP